MKTITVHVAHRTRYGQSYQDTEIDSSADLIAWIKQKFKLDNPVRDIEMRNAGTVRVSWHSLHKNSQYSQIFARGKYKVSSGEEVDAKDPSAASSSLNHNDNVVILNHKCRFFRKCQNFLKIQ